MARTLGTELQKVRKMKGLSLSAVAKPAGISATYLQKLERNQVEEPSPMIVRATWPVPLILAASASPTACRSCVATGDETDTRLCSCCSMLLRSVTAGGSDAVAQWLGLIGSVGKKKRYQHGRGREEV